MGRSFAPSMWFARIRFEAYELQTVPIGEPMQVLLLILISIAVHQTCDQWKYVTPLETKRSEFERLFGAPKEKLDGFEFYSVPNARIRVEFSGEPCQPKNSSSYDVPKDTVLFFAVSFVDLPEIASLKMDLDGFDRFSGPHALPVVFYENVKKGVRITVNSSDGKELVQKIEFRPSSPKKEKLRCKN